MAVDTPITVENGADPASIMAVDTPITMENAILMIPGEWVKHISFLDKSIVAKKTGDQKSWDGKVTETRRDGAITEIHIKFNCEEETFTMLPVGQQMYRSEDKTRMIICGDIEKPITVRGPARENGMTPDFCCTMAFHYYHPTKEESSLKIGFVGMDKKVSYNHRVPTGVWDIRPLQEDEKVLKSYPRGMDYKHILQITFNHKGEEANAWTTLYALVQGTNNVWRACGRRLKCGLLVLDYEDDLKFHKNWSIILVAAGEFNFYT